MPNVIHPGKEKEICQFVCEATPESAKVTLIVHAEILEKQLNAWVHEMLTGFVFLFLSQGNLWSCYLESRNVKLFTAGAACLTRSKDDKAQNMLNLQERLVLQIRKLRNNF